MNSPFTSPPEPDPVDESHRLRVERLFREHNDALIRILNARLRSPQEAREVAQEAYVQLLGLHDPSTVSYLQAFLFKTAINIASNRLKSQSRRQRLDPLVFFEVDAERACPAPDAEYQAAQELALIRDCLKELSPMHRKAFLLTRIKGLSVEQMARELSLNTRTAYRYVAEALARCASRLDGQAPRTGRSK